MSVALQGSPSSMATVNIIFAPPSHPARPDSCLPVISWVVEVVPISKAVDGDLCSHE